MSLGVSLVDRDVQDKLQGKLAREHPNIPGARLTAKEDRSVFHVTKPVMGDKERAQRAMPRPAAALHNNFIGEQSIDDFSEVQDP